MFIPSSLPPATPVSFMDSVGSWTSSVALPDLGEVSPVLKETWDLQTFENLQEGKVAVPDDAINQFLADSLKDQTEVSELTIASRADQTLAIHAKTKAIGRIDLICKVDLFEHNREHSLIRLKVTDKKLPDHPILSWMFARVSLAMATKLTGPIKPGHGVIVTINGNLVSVDVRQALLDSNLGQVNLFGWQPIHALSIRSATPEAGHLLLTTDLTVPENIRKLVSAFLG
ncbi:hypothetical protein [Azotosporobacter soli]|uniref:hypothetical protein n=1 Tax=Azotosporobacter soli TaxID=3055040 RepID=UPI0031FEDF25